MRIHYISASNGPDHMLFKPKKPMANLMAGDEFIAFTPGYPFSKSIKRGEYRSSLGRVSFAIQFGRKEQSYHVKSRGGSLPFNVWSLVIVTGDTKRRFHFRKLK